MRNINNFRIEGGVIDEYFEANPHKVFFVSLRYCITYRNAFDDSLAHTYASLMLHMIKADEWERREIPAPRFPTDLSHGGQVS